MAKVYIANTPLILENAQGIQFRVEAGEAVELTAEQYESVAAHVTPTLTTGEELDAQQNDTPPSEGTPSEGTPSEGTPSEGTPSEGTPSEGTPSEGTPSDGTPSEGTPSDGTGDAPAAEVEKPKRGKKPAAAEEAE